MENKLTYTLREVAPILSCHYNTVRKLVSEGKLKTLKPYGAKNRVVSKAELERFVEAHTN